MVETITTTLYGLGFALLLLVSFGASGFGVWWTLASLLRLAGVRRASSRLAALCFLFPPALLCYLVWAAMTLDRHFYSAPAP